MTGTADLVKRARELAQETGTDWRSGMPFFLGLNESEVVALLPQLADALEAATRLIEDYVPVTVAADWLSGHYATSQRKGGDDEQR